MSLRGMPSHQLVRQCVLMVIQHIPTVFVCKDHFNGSMSKVRSSGEWMFGDIINYFKFSDFKKDLRMDLSPIGKMYIVCA